MGKYLSCCSMGNTIGAYTRYIINMHICMYVGHSRGFGEN